jgi:hypothetical protein
MVRTWEKVHTVHDFFDRPRSGVADWDGVPHAYKCRWNDAADDWDEIFSLAPLGSAEMAAIMEQWAIWLRWRAAHDAGTLTPEDHHPALARDRARYDALTPTVAQALGTAENGPINATAEFRGCSMGLLAGSEVRWTQT